MSKSEETKERYAFPAAALLTEPGIKFSAPYRIWIVAAAWLVARGVVIAVWGLTPDSVVEGYFQAAGDWLDGYAPYAEFKAVHPPGALLLLTLLGIFTDSAAAYGYGLAILMLIADVGILLMLVRLVAPAGADGKNRSDTERQSGAVLLCLIYILFTAIFGRMLLQRYDLVLALLLIIIIDASLRKKQLLADVMLAAAIGLNPTAVVWIPLTWCYGFISQSDEDATADVPKIQKLYRALLPRLAVLGGCLGALFLPFILLSGRALGNIVQFYLELGLQIESSAAGLLLVGAKLTGIELATGTTQQVIHLIGSASYWGAISSAILLISVLVILSIYLGRQLQAQSDDVSRGIQLIQGLLITTLVLLAFTPVFLAQYILWIMPLAALCAHAKQPRLRDVGWRLCCAALLTAILGYFYTAELGKAELLPGIILLGRNALIIWSAIALLLLRICVADFQDDGFQRSQPGKQLPVQIATALLFIWGTLAAFCPVSSNDIWLLLREAADIVANVEIPRVEEYSAVAAGRPYLAHEWLSGLIFLGISKLGGGEALTVLRAALMLAMLLLLWFSLEKTNRSFVLAAPLLALAAYTILIRVFVRPHIFTHLFLCVWVFSLEHWRRERRLRYLVMLVPLQVLWANLHGGYIFAVLLGAIMTGSTAVLVLRPGWATDERYAWSDVAKLAVLTAACFAASLINPNGLRLLEFSLTVGLASDYIKQVIFEWASPLAPIYSRSYGREAAIGMCLLLWSGLALNVKRRPFLDAMIALLATLTAVQAVRFLSFIGMLGFPIVVRTWRAVAASYAEALPVKRLPLIEAALFGLLLASTLIYGFPYGKAKHRQVGWGFGGRMPYEEARFIAEHGIQGAVYNDYGDGAYLIYRLYPKNRPVMDSRIDVYGDALCQEYFTSRDHPKKFFQYLNKYNVSLILLRKSRDNLQINNYLDNLEATKLLLETERRLLFSYDPDLLPPELMTKKAP